jgi:hypothetical protein
MQSFTRSQADALCESLSSPTARTRFRAAKLLVEASRQSPGVLYSRFDFFVQLLDADNRILRWNAVRILGNLAAADHENKLDALLDRLFAPIPGPEMITAANAIAAAAAVALAKPHLADRIATEVLKVKRARYATRVPQRCHRPRYPVPRPFLPVYPEPQAGARIRQSPTR